MDTSQLAAELNPAQLEAVTYCDGPSLVIAGAGSGKTRVLTYKIAYLLDNGFAPWSLMALTFTNKAAREMNDRIARLCDNVDLRALWSGTFHSLFARLLRMEHEHIGYPADYTIYDTTDSRSLLKSIVREMGLDDKVYKPAALSSRISEAKNHLILPEQYAAQPSKLKRDDSDGMPKAATIYATYQQRLRAAAAMDFDDLLLNTYLLLRNNDEVRERYKKRFAYILVDEYQDTNIAQHQILSLLTDKDSRICVVGDDAQSIYGFRGADITNILNFQQNYPGARIIKLECNYRSTQCIVEAANSLIVHNSSQIPKKVFSAGDEGNRIKVFDAQTDKEEARQVVSRVVRLKRREGVGYDDMAVLYRTNAQSRALEEAFQQAALPYRIYGGLSFYQRKEIKDVLAYCRLVSNPNDEEAFKRVINYPQRGIGATTQQKIQLAAAAHGASLWSVANDPKAYDLNVNAGTARKIAGFCSLITAFRELAETHTASDVAREIIRSSGIAADITAEHDAESISRQENVDELLGSIVSFERDRTEETGQTRIPMTDFLASVSLLSDTDNSDKNDKPSVTLMTIHSAKGLEFDAVFITGMEEDLFPNANARLYRKEMEEERRLFYVALTRAKRFCFLSYAHMRFRYGNMQFAEPSPFIDEVDEVYLDRHDGDKNPALQRDLWQSNRGNTFGQSRPQTDDRSFWNQSATNRRTVGTGNPSGFQTPRKPAQTPPRPLRPASEEAVQRRVPVRQAVNRPSTGRSTALPPIGARINHERFGMGTLTGTEGAGDSAAIRVDFDQAGTKKLLVKFARFTIES